MNTIMRPAILLLLLASCAATPVVPHSLAEFEAHSASCASGATYEELTRLHPMDDWALLHWTSRSHEDPETYPYEVPLFANGIASLDVEQALALAQFSGDQLFVQDLRALDPASAAALASGRHELFLDGLTSISAETARAIVDGGTSRLSLKGVSDLDPRTAAILAELNGSLHLDGLAAPSLATVQALATWKGWGEQVILHVGVVEPTVAAIHALSALKGWGIALDQIGTLSSERARALGTIVRPYIALNGLRTIEDASAAVIAGWQAKFLILNGLVTLSAANRALLERGCEGLSARSLPTSD